MSELNQHKHDPSQSALEEELITLRKQTRSQEAEWRKNKAVLEQRIEILEMQNKELKEREENLKKMNNSIFSALKDFNKENDPTYAKIVKELEESKQQISREYSDLKARSQEIIKAFDKENKELKEKYHELETKHNQMTLHYEKNDAALNQRVQNLESEKKNTSLILKLYEEERKQYKEKVSGQSELQVKVTELKEVLEKQSDEHRKEIEKLHQEYAQKITNMRFFSESEKTTLENQIHKLLESKKLEGTLFEDLKKNHEREAGLLRKERDESFKRNEGLEQYIAQLHDNIKTLESKVSQHKTEHDKEVRDLKRTRTKITDLESQLRKYENVEKNLKQMLAEKENRIEEVTQEYKKKYINEKRKYEQAQELVKKYKEDSDKKCSIIIQENIKKEEQIKKLKVQSKVREEKSAQKYNEVGKTNLSLASTSLLSQSISASKFKKGRNHIPEAKTSREPSNSKSLIQTKKGGSKLYRELTSTGKKVGTSSLREILMTNEDEEDIKDITDENILLSINSPRDRSCSKTYRDFSSVKKDLRSSLVATNFSTEKNMESRKGEKPLLNIEPCHDGDFDDRITEDKSNMYSQRGGKARTGRLHEHSGFAASFEFKKKNTMGDIHSHKEKPTRDYSEDSRKITSIDFENSRSFINANDFPENLNSASINITDKNGVSLNLNPGIYNLPRGLKEILENTHKSRVNTASDIQDESKHIKGLEERLRESEQINQRVALEKDKLQIELDRLILELKQTKMEWALSEESKEECELTLKNEIKFLINQLLQSKYAGTKSINPSTTNNLHISRGALNKSVLDPQSSFVNTSEFLNCSHYLPSRNFGSFVSNSGNQDQRTLTIMNNFDEKEEMREIQMPYLEQSETPLKIKNLNTSDFEQVNDSPQKMNEFHKNENNSLLKNLLSTSTNSKKLLRHIKS